MGGCATKPRVLKGEEEAPLEAPPPAVSDEKVAQGTDIAAADRGAGEEIGHGDDTRHQSLGNLLKENEEGKDDAEAEPQTVEPLVQAGEAEQLKTENPEEAFTPENPNHEENAAPVAVGEEQPVNVVEVEKIVTTEISETTESSVIETLKVVVKDSSSEVGQEATIVETKEEAELPVSSATRV